MFTTWFSAEIQRQMESGNSTDEIKVEAEALQLHACHLAGEPL